MSNTLGDKKALKPNLFQYVKELEDRTKLMTFENVSADTQFNIVFTFDGDVSNIKALGTTQVDGSKFALTIYPTETKQFIQGRWSGGIKWSIGQGLPDGQWQASRSLVAAEDVQKEILNVKLALKAHPKADAKYTAEYISDVCIKTGTPFVDLTFSPRTESLCRDYESPKPPPCSWMRPKVYCTEKPCLYVNLIEPNDIDQGGLGDCYLMCSMACISEFPHLVKDIFCPTQYDEIGCYSCRVCKNGWWQVCVVDDLLPINPATKIPIYAKNRDEPHELWVSLLEKAYAKLHGSYAAIRQGDAALAMADLIGGPYIRFSSIPNWDAKGDDVFQMLKDWDDKNYLLTLGTPGKDLNPMSGSAVGTQSDRTLASKYKAVGLCTGHAFSLISVVEVKGQKLCKIRNPWGNAEEWNGDWGDDSPLWTQEMKDAVGFVAANDGTFWMAWEDVGKWFTSGSVTFVLPTWHQLRVAGNFEGGCPDVVVRMDVTKVATRMWVGMHQRDTRGVTSGDKDSQYVGMMVAVLHQQRLPSGELSGRSLKIGGNGSFVSARDVFTEVTLEPSTQPYFILCQAFQETDKSFVQSLFIEEIDGLTVTFVSSPDGAPKKKCNPPSLFEAKLHTQRVKAQYQLLSPKYPVKVPQNITDDCVDWRRQLDSQMPQVQPKRVIQRTAPETAMESISAAVRVMNVRVTVISGKGLVSKDSNGLSDPFVTIKILDENGRRYPNIQKQSTKYINETLNPVWGESFTFQVRSSDQFFCACWDKDIFGKDAMGTVTIPVSSLGLKIGGEGRMKDYELTGGDATGSLQLLFTSIV